MFAAEWRWQGVWHSFPFLAWDLSMHLRRKILFSTNLYALEHVHVVQIWIMHINALKTQLMHKNFQTNPKNHKNSHNTHVVLCWHEKKKLKAIWGNGYRFIPKGGMFPTENHHACCENLRFVWSIYPNLPQMGKKLPWHVDAAPR